MDKGRLALALGLVALMVTTRFDHFGSAVSLPDASLAVFFLAGFYLAVGWLPVLLATAAAVDVYAVGLAGVSDWCITGAYPFLAGAYGALWAGGRWYARRHAPAWRSLLPLTVAAVLSTLAAFVISNASFYAFSGYFGDMGALEYASRVARYLPGYSKAALLWLALAAGLQVTLAMLKAPVRADV